MLRNLISIVLSTVFLAFVAVALLSTTAPIKTALVDSTNVLLDSSTPYLVQALQHYGQRIPTLAEDLAFTSGLDADLDDLSALYNSYDNSGRSLKQLKQLKQTEEKTQPIPSIARRIDTLNAKHLNYAASSRKLGASKKSSSIDGVVFFNDAGKVIWSDSPRFPLDTILNPTETANKSLLPKAIVKMVAQTLGGSETQFQPYIFEGKLFYGACSFVENAGSGDVVGGVLLEHAFTGLPTLNGMDSTLVTHNGQVLSGTFPKGTALNENDMSDLAAGKTIIISSSLTEATATVFGIDITALSSSIGLNQTDNGAGIWVRQFNVAALSDVSGYLFYNITPSLSPLMGLKTIMTLTLLIIWFFYTVVLALQGRTIRRAITAMADTIGRVQRGVGNERALNERQLPGALQRLAKLINKLLEQKYGTGLIPGSNALSVEDVLQAQSAGGPDSALADTGVPDFSGLDFDSLSDESSSDSPSTSGISSPATSAAPAPEFSAATAVFSGDALAAARAAASLPSAPTASVSESPQQTPVISTVPTATPAVAFGAATEVLSGEVLAAARAAASGVLPTGGAANGVSPQVTATPATPAVIPPANASTPAPAGEFGAATAIVSGDLLAEARAAMVAPVAAATPPPPPAEESLDNYFRTVYDNFVATRESCGEQGHLGYEKFAKRLGQSRTTVIEKHGCRGVLFQVYVKNGKAALKATPER